MNVHVLEFRIHYRVTHFAIYLSDAINAAVNRELARLVAFLEILKFRS